MEFKEVGGLYPYKVMNYKISLDESKIINQWIIDNKLKCSYFLYAWYFKTKKDAVRFLLRWS